GSRAAYVSPLSKSQSCPLRSLMTGRNDENHTEDIGRLARWASLRGIPGGSIDTHSVAAYVTLSPVFDTGLLFSHSKIIDERALKSRKRSHPPQHAAKKSGRMSAFLPRADFRRRYQALRCGRMPA